jgi:ornithine--oxo-acid transaminase
MFRPGQHGSTFGGNPLACAVGTAVVRRLKSGDLQWHTADLGRVMADILADLGREVSQARSIGLWAGVDFLRRTARDVGEGLLRRNILTKDAHGRTIRLAPPLVKEEDELRWGLNRLLSEVEAP